MTNNEAIALLQRAADRADAMLEMAQLAATDARAIAKLLKEQELAVKLDDNPFYQLWTCGNGSKTLIDGDALDARRKCLTEK